MAVWVMVARRLFLWYKPSSTPVTVTVCLVFQLEAVKVKVAGLTVAAAGTPERILDRSARIMLTRASGWVSSITV